MSSVHTQIRQELRVGTQRATVKSRSKRGGLKFRGLPVHLISSPIYLLLSELPICILKPLGIFHHFLHLLVHPLPPLASEIDIIFFPYPNYLVSS